MTKVTKKYLGAQAADSVSSTNERDELLDNPTSSSEGVDEYLGGVSHAAPVGSPVDSGGGTHLFATPITLPDGAVIFDPHWLPGQTGAFFPVSSSSSIGSHEINAMRDSLDLYDKLILVLDLPIFLPVDVRKARVNAVYQQLQSRLKATEMEKIHVVGSTMPFADLMDEWGMRTMLRSVPMNNLESVLADDKYQTMYVIPSSSLAYLPVDDFIEKRLEAVLVYLTGLLQKYFPQETEYQKTLARSRIDAMAAEKPLLQRLGESLPAADPMVAFYPGSFDPLTNGHLDILRQALGTFKKIYVGVATNPNKKYKYSSAIRKELILESLRNAGLTNVEVIDYPTSTPTAKMASSLGAGTLIRGVRDLADLKYELVLSWTTHVLDPRLRTVLLKSKDYASVSSSGTKVNFEARQDISRVVPGPVYWELMRDELAKWPHRPRLVGLVGGIGSGKSTVRQGFQNDGRVLTIDFDKVWHDLMADSVVAAELVAAFGTEILVEGQVDRVKLREVAFSGDERKRLTLSHIARIHVMRKAFEIIQDTAHEHPEISTILFEGYGLVNGGMYRVLDELWFVDTPEETRIERVLKDSHRGHQTREHVARVMASQRAILEAARAKADVVLDNSKGKPHLVDQITLARALSFFKTNWDEVKDYLGIEDEDGSIFEKMFPPKGAEMESKEFYVARDRMALFVALQEAESKADRELFQKALYARAGEESEKAAAVRRDRTEDLLSRLKADVPEWIRRAVGPLERIDPIALNAHAWAEQVAVVSGGQKITYGELDDHADRLALFIKTMNQTPVMGMYPIGMVGMYFLSGNHPEHMEIALGAKRAGAPYTPFSSYLDPETLVYSLVSGNYRILFVDSAGLKAIGPHMGHLMLTETQVVLMDGESNYPEVIPYYRILSQVGRPQEPATTRTDNHDLEAVLYTSGTTGVPKRIERLASSLRVHPRFQIGTEDRYLVTASLFHGGYIRWSNQHLFNGGRVYLAPIGDAEAYLRLIEKEQITSLLIPPVVLRRMLTAYQTMDVKPDVSSLKRLIVIGAPFAEDLKIDSVKIFGPGRVWDSYATTEWGSITILTPDEMLEHAKTVGRPVASVTVEIRDADGKVLPVGAVGHVYVNTPFTNNAFIKTDDDGSLDEEGYLTLAGRRSDLILSRGINFYSGEIESDILKIPQVEEVAVMGIPHPEYGEEIVAAIVLKKGIQVSISWLKKQIKELVYDKRAVPRQIAILDSLPRNSAGKIIASELKKKLLHAMGESSAIDSDGLSVHLSRETPETVPILLSLFYGSGYITPDQMIFWAQAIDHLKTVSRSISDVALMGAILGLSKKGHIESFVSLVLNGMSFPQALDKTLNFNNDEPASERMQKADKAIESVAASMNWVRQNKGEYPSIERFYRNVFRTPQGLLFSVDFLYRYEKRCDFLVISQLLNHEGDKRKLSIEQIIPYLLQFAKEQSLPLIKIIFNHTNAVLPWRMSDDNSALKDHEYPRWDTHLRRFGTPALESSSRDALHASAIFLEDGRRMLVTSEANESDRDRAWAVRSYDVTTGRRELDSSMDAIHQPIEIGSIKNATGQSLGSLNGFSLDTDASELDFREDPNAIKSDVTRITPLVGEQHLDLLTDPFAYSITTSGFLPPLMKFAL